MDGNTMKAQQIHILKKNNLPMVEKPVVPSIDRNLKKHTKISTESDDKEEKKRTNIMDVIEEEVKEILRKSKRARNDDGYLGTIWLINHKYKINGKQENTKLLNQLQSVWRARRHIQSLTDTGLGLYLSDKQIKKMRDEREEEMTDWAVQDQKEDDE